MPGKPMTVFKCWKCEHVLQKLDGEAHAVLTQVKCPCGELNALFYIFPLAAAETIYEG